MTYQLIQAADIAQAHTDSAGEQYHSAITPLADGGVLVVFEQRVRPDTSVYIYDVDVSAQRYDASGAPVGGLISLARLDDLPQSQTPSYYPVAVGLAGGGYAIGWHDRASDDLRVQTFDAAGGLLGDRLLDLPNHIITSGAGGEQSVAVTAMAGVNGSIAALDNGGFAVVWNAAYSGMLAQYAGAATVYSQTFSATGAPVSAPRQIMPWVGTGSYSQDYQNVAQDAVAISADRFLVVLRGGEGSPGNLSDHPAVLGRIFDILGAPVGDSFMISQSLGTWADRGSVAVLENGDFVVAWRGQTGSYWRRFDSDGDALTDAMSLDINYTGIRVSAMPDGGFLITTIGDGYDTFGFRYDADNALVDGRFIVTSRRAPDYDTNYYAFPPEFVTLGSGQLMALVEGHASWNGNAFEVMTWMQKAEHLGTQGNDTLTASDDGMALFGRDGNDLLQGGMGDDLLDGAAGNDTLNGGQGNDTLRAGNGQDVVQGGAGTDHIVIGSRVANITVRGPAESLTIIHAGGQTVVQGVETFEFRAGLYADLRTLAEVLSLRAMTVTGTVGADTITGDFGNDRLYGGGGDDLITGGAGDDRIEGQTGNDTLNGNSGNDTIYGGVGNDSVLGGIGWDDIRGDDGDDVLFGQDGYDSLFGGAGNDLLVGNNGFDLLDGGAGNDTLYGGVSPDTLLGGVGDDVLQGDAGADSLDGGIGNDTLHGNAGMDTLQGGAGDDLLDGGINDDRLDGGDGNDSLNGGNGADILLGGAGNDVLQGNAGDDTLDGGAGADYLRGGVGVDTFVFRAGHGQDTVDDFRNNIDIIQIDSALMAQANPVPDDLRAMASLNANGFLVLTFGNGDTLTFSGVTNTGTILDEVVFI